MLSKSLQAAILSIILLVPTQVEAYAANTMLENLIGSWKGRGIVTPNLGSKKENIRCRLQNLRSGSGSRLNIIGNCSVGGLLLPVNGWIKQKSASTSYTASLFQSLARISSNFFSGKLRGKKLRLGYNGVDNLTKEKIDASLIIVDKGAKNFDVQIRRTDPATKKKFNVGTIKFSKR